MADKRQLYDKMYDIGWKLIELAHKEADPSIHLSGMMMLEKADKFFDKHLSTPEQF